MDSVNLFQKRVFILCSSVSVCDWIDFFCVPLGHSATIIAKRQTNETNVYKQMNVTSTITVPTTAKCLCIEFVQTRRQRRSLRKNKTAAIRIWQGTQENTSIQYFELPKNKTIYESII